jgi:hypothetical protein
LLHIHEAEDILACSADGAESARERFVPMKREQKGRKTMIKDAGLLEQFNDELLRKEKLDYAAALRIFEGMWEEGRKLGVLPLKDPLEGIEVDIRIARILNHV